MDFFGFFLFRRELLPLFTGSVHSALLIGLVTNVWYWFDSLAKQISVNRPTSALNGQFPYD